MFAQKRILARKRGKSHVRWPNISVSPMMLPITTTFDFKF